MNIITTTKTTPTAGEGGAGLIEPAPILVIEESGRNEAEGLEPPLEVSVPKPRRQRKTTVVHTCPRPPGGYKYSMEFLYGIGSGMAGVTLNIPTPSSITPRTLRTTAPLLTTHMPLLSTMGVPTPRSAGCSASGIRYAGAVGLTGAPGAGTAAGAATTTTLTTASSSAGSGAEGVTGSVSSGSLPASAAGGIPAAQFIYQGYLPTGPQRRLWHTENAVWQFDRNYPYNQAYSSQFGIPMMPVGFEHPYGQRIIYPGYYNQATAGLHATVPGMSRTSRHVTTQQPHLLAQPAAPGEATEEAPPSLANTPQVSNPWRYGRPGAHRDRLGSGRQGVATTPGTTVYHRDSKTFYNSITGGMGGGPRYKTPFVANPRSYQSGGTVAAGGAAAAGEAAAAAGGAGTTTAVATAATPATVATSSNEPAISANNRSNQGSSTHNFSRNRHSSKKGGKNSVGKEQQTSHSSGSLSNSSSKSQLDRHPTSSSTSISPSKQSNRIYKNRMRYNANAPAEQKSQTTAAPMSNNYQPPQRPQSGGRRTSKFQGGNAYQGHTANRQQSRYYQSRHMDTYVYQPGHYMVYPSGSPVLGAASGGAAAAAGGVAGSGVPMPGGAGAGSSGGGAGAVGGGGAATVTASSATSEGEQPLDSDFDQRQEYADLGLDPANGGFSSDLEPFNFKQDTSELDAHSCLLSHPSSEVDDGRSFASLAPSVESDGTESDLSEASVESVVRDIMVSCLALATGAQEPDLSGPNLVPYGDMHHLKELERKSQHTGLINGYRSHMHHTFSPRGMSCCGDMLSQPTDDLVYKLDPDQQDVYDAGKSHLKEITEEPDNISVASNLSCSPSACSSKSAMAPSSAKVKSITVG